MESLGTARGAWLARLEERVPSAAPGAVKALAAGVPSGWRARLGLSEAEAAVITLAALAVVDGEVAVACGQARGRPEEPWPNLSLALRMVPGLTWPMIASSAPLRAAGLVVVTDAAVPMRSRLHCPERVWSALVGARVADPELVRVAGPPPAAQVALDAAAPPLHTLSTHDLVVVGTVRETSLAAAAAFVRARGGALLRVRADLLPAEVSRVTTALRREWVMENAVVVLDLLDADAEGRGRAWRLLRGLWGHVVRLERSPVAMGERPFVPWVVAAPSLHQRVAEWEDVLSIVQLGDADRTRLAWRLADAFRLSASARHTVAAMAARSSDPEAAVWSAAAAHSTRPPGNLVHVHTATTVGWDGLVVEAPVKAALQELVDAARDRARVMSAWGMSVGRAGGLTALFTGPSGTGKTLAAEVVARELGLTLWRIDLSMVVSKYIGETEKHLGKVFDAAEGAGVILLFDEADSLFAQRSDVGDSRDRYANLEVGFLLQRIEAFAGLAILTTNLEDQLDAAFQRRLFSVVRFGFPSRAQRARLWALVFPDDVPTEGLDPDKLAQVNLNGAGIRAVATRAAFACAAQSRAAGHPVPITMQVLADATRSWMQQHRKALSPREVDGWV